MEVSFRFAKGLIFVNFDFRKLLIGLQVIEKLANIVTPLQ